MQRTLPTRDYRPGRETWQLGGRLIGAWLAGVMLFTMLSAVPALAQTGNASSSKRLERPRSTLNQTFDAPIFLGFYGQIGGGFQFDHGQPGGGALFLFRPARAANFLPFLYNWNASLVLQADYQKVSPDSRILSGDLIIRRYFKDMRGQKTSGSLFLGAGLGGSEVVLPRGSGGGPDQYWSWLVEAGKEWGFRSKYLLFAKGQYRHYSYGGFDFSTWSVQAGAGLPLPW